MDRAGKEVEPLPIVTATMTHYLLAAALLSVSPPQVVLPPPDSLRAAIERVLRQTHGVAAAVAWVKMDSTLEEGVMVVAASSGPTLTDSSLFRLASVSKTLTALGVIALAQDGGLTLEAPVSALVPGLRIKNPWASTRPVRVADLLEHTAGFDNLAPGHFYDVTGTPRGLAEVTRELAPELVVRWPPGDRWSYSSAGYAVAAYVVEAVVGQPFEEWLPGRVLSRLGWRDGALRYSPGTVPMEALHGFDPPQHRVLAFPAGDGNASARDMLYLLRFFVERGRVKGDQVLDSAWVLRMERPTTGRLARAGVTWGTGSGLYSVVRAGHRFWGHGGDMPGFHNEFFYSADLGVGYAILTASMNRETRTGIRDLLVDGLVPHTPPVDVFRVRIEGVPEGWYRIANPRNAVLAPLDRLLYSARVEIDGATLSFKPLLGDAAVFDHVGGFQLRERGQPLPTQAFLPAEADSPPALMIDSFFLLPTTAFEALSGPLVALFGVLGMVIGVPLFMVTAIWDRRRCPRAVVAGVGILTISLFATVGSALNLDLLSAGTATPAVLLFFAAPIAFGAALCFTAYRGVGAWRRVGRAQRFATALVVAASSGLFALMLLGGYVGLRLWN